MSEHLIADPVERKKRAREKEEWVLWFLRDEIYSSTAILAEEMCIGVRAARNVLNRMEKRGLLVKDAVQFMGMKALPLWGITSTGILHELAPEEVETVNLRYHTPGRVSPRTIEHTLDVQRCRQYCLFNLEYDDWKPSRLLPWQHAKRNDPKRWSVYPDGLVYNENEQHQAAIEVERTRKTPARYVQIIRGHLSNIKKGCYEKVMYFCPTKKEALSLRALFLRLISEKKISYFKNDHEMYSGVECIRFFSFDAMELFRSNLPETPATPINEQLEIAEETGETLCT